MTASGGVRAGASTKTSCSLKLSAKKKSIIMRASRGSTENMCHEFRTIKK